MSNISTSYFKGFVGGSKSMKRQIAVYLTDEQVQDLDNIVEVFTKNSSSKGFSRTGLIEEAINKYIEGAKAFSREEYGIDLDAPVDKKYNTVILSSKDRGFEETFLGEQEAPCWYPCMIDEKRYPHLEYIAVYRGDPISAITHYAPIKEIKFSSERGCKVCYFDGEPRELPNKIPLGSKNNAYFRGAKYATFDSLLRATVADDIVFISS